MNALLPYLLIFALALVLGLVGGVTLGIIVHRWKRKPDTLRTLVDFTKSMPRYPTAEEQKERAKGNSLVLGTCDYWIEKRRFPFFAPRIAITRDRFVLPEETRYRNMLVLGLTGSGKTQAMLSYMEQDIARLDNAVVIIDVKGDLTEKIKPRCELAGRELVVLPDEGGFNPFNGEGDVDDIAKAASNLYVMTTDVGGKDKAVEHWGDVVTLYVKNLFPLYKSVAHQPIIPNEVLSHMRSEEVRERLLAEAGNSPEAYRYREAIHERWNNPDFKNSLRGFEVFLDSLSHGKIGVLFNQRRAPTLRELIDRKAVIVIRKQGGEQGTQEHRQGLIFMSALQQWALHRDLHQSSHTVMIYLDEAQFYLSHSFQPFITDVRGFNAGLVLGVQNLEQLEPYVGTVSGNARTKVANPGVKYEDAVEIAKEIGMARWKVRGRAEGEEDGSNPRMNESEQHDYIVQPSEITDIEGNEAYLVTLRGLKKESPVKLEKRSPLDMQPVIYIPPPMPDYPPANYWDEHPEAEEAEILQQQIAPHPTPQGPLTAQGTEGAGGLTGYSTEAEPAPMPREEKSAKGRKEGKKSSTPAQPKTSTSEGIHMLPTLRRRTQSRRQMPQGGRQESSQGESQVDSIVDGLWSAKDF